MLPLLMMGAALERGRLWELVAQHAGLELVPPFIRARVAAAQVALAAAAVTPDHTSGVRGATAAAGVHSECTTGQHMSPPLTHAR